MPPLRMNTRHIVSICGIIFCIFNIVLVIQKATLPNINSGTSLAQKNTELPPDFYVLDDKEKVLWPNDSECSTLSVRFAVKTDKVYLFSYPRSGNSWTRYLIEAATGVFTGSVYDDKRSYELGFYGEREKSNSGRVTAIKSHGQALWNEALWSFKKRESYIKPDDPVILVIRDPTDAIRSFYSLYRAVKTKGGDSKNTLFTDIPEEQYKTTEFQNFFQDAIEKWKEMNLDRLMWSKRLLVVFYEELIEDPITQLQRMVTFLGFPIDGHRFHCVAKNLEGPAKRKHDQHEGIYSLSQKQDLAYAITDVVSVANIRNIKAPQEYMTKVKSYTSVFS